MMRWLRVRMTRGSLRWFILTALIVLVAFEVGIRFAPADSLTFVQADANGQTEFSYTTHDLAMVRAWRAYVNGEPTQSSLSVQCDSAIYPRAPQYLTFTFSWHGIPVESAWTSTGPLLGNDGNLCDVVMLSSGGVPNMFSRTQLHANPSTTDSGPPPPIFVPAPVIHGGK